MKIRGNTVGTTLKPERAVVAAKNLTPEQQKQARDNIGASALIVTETNGELSHTLEQICNHIKNGGIAYLLADYRYMPIIADDNDVIYANFIFDDGFAYYYEAFTVGNVAKLVRAEHEYAHQSQFISIKQQMGDIDTALDGIIAIQNSLIGGDA